MTSSKPFSLRNPYSVRAALAAILAALIALAACGDAPGGSDADATISELEMDEVFRVGTIEGSGWEAFANLNSVAFDANGRLYVMDVGQSHVVVLEPDGSFVRTIGTRGEGPEELHVPRSMTVLGSGEVAIWDMGHQAFLVFSPEGEFRRSIRAPIDEGMPGQQLWPHGQTGVVTVSRNMRITQRAGQAPEIPTTAPVRRFELAEGGTAEVLHEAWMPPLPESGGQVSIGPARIAAPGMRAFEPRVHLAALPDGRMVVADSSSYRLRVLGPEGSETAVLTRDVAPHPVGDAEQEAERERRLAELDEGGGPQIQIRTSDGAAPAIDAGAVSDMFRNQIEGMIFWHEIPVIDELSTDWRGRIWVARSGGVDDEGPIDLLAPDGTLLAVLPPDFGPVPDAFGPDGLAAWIERDEFDVPYVRVRRIVGLPNP